METKSSPYCEPLKPIEGFTEQIDALLKEHGVKHDEFAGKLLAESVRQAIYCGDFLNYVRVDNGAMFVSYIPYRRVEELEDEVERLKEENERLKRCSAEANQILLSP